MESKPSVLLITRYFPPLESIATLRMLSWAQYLHKAGYSVSVLTTSKEGQIVVPMEADLSCFDVTEVPYFDPISRFTGEKREMLKSVSEGCSFKKWAVQFYRSRMNERMPGRTDSWILPAIRTLKKQWRDGIRYSTIISSYGPLSAHVVGRYAQKLFGAQWVADYRDLWVENASYTGLWPFTVIEKQLEKRLLSRASLITTVSDPYRDFLEKKFPGIPVKTITNGFEPALIDQAEGNRFEDKPDKFRIVYTGALYRKTRDPSPLFQALKGLLERGEVTEGQIEILFYGGVADGLQELIDRYQLSSIAHYKGSVSQKEAYALQKSADALLFVEDPHPKVPGVLTGKLFEYLYVGKPILAIGVGVESSAGALIDSTSCGEVCGVDVEKIAAVLLKWVQNGAMARSNRDAILSYSRENQAKELIKSMERLTNECAI